jgi:hypothetical protein
MDRRNFIKSSLATRSDACLLSARSPPKQPLLRKRSRCLPTQVGGNGKTQNISVATLARAVAHKAGSSRKRNHVQHRESKSAAFLGVIVP